MRIKRFISLLLVAILTFFCTATSAYAAEDEATEQKNSTSVPYMLRTAPANNNGNYFTNTVNVWLELDPVKAESVASYQITLKLVDSEGSIVSSRGMELDFDKTVKDMAKVHEWSFDAETQIMKIWVASDKNLVQTTDENGVAVNKLPIGTITVQNLSEDDDDFKIAINGKTGDLKTVNTSMEAVDVAEAYGEKFIIPSDGILYGGPRDYALEIKVAEGKGTVKAFVIGDNGKETLAGKMVSKNASVRMQVTPDAGYRLTDLILTDKKNPDNSLTLNGNYNFTMDRAIEISAKFEAVEVTHTVTVGAGGSISGTTEKSVSFKEREIATVIATIPNGKKFTGWENENNVIVSYNQRYSFYVTSDVTLTPVFDQEQTAAVALSKDGIITKVNGNFRLSYSGVCTLPKDCTMVKVGIVLTNQEIRADNIADFESGKQVNSVNVATCALYGNYPQFIININNVKPGQSRTARAFMTYKNASGIEETIYSTNYLELTT